MKKAFTLAEVMIVLTVIGVLTAILLPVARQSMPDEDLMKFKKAHNTLGTVIRELVTSDKYYSDGELAKMPNGNYVDSATYFCETMADILNTKKVECEDVSSSKESGITLDSPNRIPQDDLDMICDMSLSEFSKPQITTVDNILIWEADPSSHFGIKKTYTLRENETPYHYYTLWDGKLSSKDADGNWNSGWNDHYDVGFYYAYKGICIDIDEFNNGVAPFGYGIRVDGKIMTGTRAQQWLERNINEE